MTPFSWLLLYAGWLLTCLSRRAYFQQLCPEWRLSAKRQWRLRLVGIALLLCSYLVLAGGGWSQARAQWLGSSLAIVTLLVLLQARCSSRLMGWILGIPLLGLCILVLAG